MTGKAKNSYFYISSYDGKTNLQCSKLQATLLNSTVMLSMKVKMTS